MDLKASLRCSIMELLCSTNLEEEKEGGEKQIMAYSYVYKDHHPALGELANRLTEVTLTVAICTSLINPGGCNIKVYQIYIIQ